MKKYLVISATVAGFLLLSCQKNSPITGSDREVISETAITTSCGQLRTQSPGGWGSTPEGNNPGTYLHANFANAFPWSLMIGCRDGNTITLTSAQAITNLLPTGGKPAVLGATSIDPVGIKNTLVGHVVSLTLSVGFDAYDQNFGSSPVLLGDMLIGSGPFAQMTVSQFLQIANDVIGGCCHDYSVNDIIITASQINSNYLDGTVDLGFLKCPDDGGPRRIAEQR
ncbi:MAG TPA: hypothetical protein VM012_07925 [Flavitalea sp.]|nr:hypothetical protein [Flavitalea sp.]